MKLSQLLKRLSRIAVFVLLRLKMMIPLEEQWPLNEQKIKNGVLKASNLCHAYCQVYSKDEESHEMNKWTDSGKIAE